MGYFEDVYLKRLNRYGNNLQERIQNKKINHFKTILKKSPDQVKIFKDGQAYRAILESKTNNEKEVINFLIVSKDLNWDLGTQVVSEHLVDLTQKKWLLFHFDEVVSSGYNKYWVLENNRQIEWIKDGIYHKEWVHFDKNNAVARNFAIQFSISGIYLPNRSLNIIMKTNNDLKLGEYVYIDDESWKVSSIDKITIPGLSYIVLEEQYTDKNDLPLDKTRYLQSWSIQSSKGDDIIEIKLSNSSIVDFNIYYNNDLRNESYDVVIENNDIVHYSNGEFTGKALGETNCIVRLRANPEIEKQFVIKVVEIEKEQYIIVGPERVRQGTDNKYIVPFGDFTYSSLKGLIEIKSLEENNLYIKATSIGKDKIIVKENDNIICEKEVDIVSMWLEV